MTRGAAIVWFRRDLRLQDHPALLAAADAHDTVLPLFVLDPVLLRGRFASPNRTWFLLGSIAVLRESLRALGSDLVVRVGDARVIVPDLAADVQARDVYVSRDHSPYGRQRDADVGGLLASSGVAWHARRGVLAHEPEEVLNREGRPFSVFSPFHRAWDGVGQRGTQPPPDRLPPLPTLAATTGPGRTALAPGPIPSLGDLALDGPTADVARLPVPGEAAARRRLDRWLRGGIDTYARTRDRLDLEDGTSRLSADLHLGLLSPTEVVERADAAGSEADRAMFVRELVWREFYAHLLFHRPTARTEALVSAFSSLPWATDDPGFDAWREGRTGYPTVDAAMRQLASSGWMHNRARMIAASFLTKHLMIDWRRGEVHFMRHLVDGDVASNNGGWQWAASTGADAQPYFRIFNPVLQGRRFDPDGAYIRRWVPELRRVPTAHIHDPWRLTSAEQEAAACRMGRDYPAPIVDHAEARRRALALYEAARRTS